MEHAATAFAATVTFAAATAAAAANVSANVSANATANATTTTTTTSGKLKRYKRKFKDNEGFKVNHALVPGVY